MSTIGSFFDLLDDGIDAFENLSGMPSSRERRRAPPSASSGDRRKPAPAPTATTAVVVASSARRTGSFRVVEATDADTGRTSYVVTNGRDRAECSSAEFAARVRDALG